MQHTGRRPVHRRRLRAAFFWAFICIFLCVCFLFLGAFSTPAGAATATEPGGNVANPVVRQTDLARPAVVRIITTLGGRLSVSFTSTGSMVTFPLNGGSYPLELSGSGAFISAHGDLLTADHVVNPPLDQSMADYLYEVAASDIATYVDAHYAVDYSADDIVAFLEEGAFPSTPSYGPPSSEVYVSTSYAGAINASSMDDVPASDHATVDRIEEQSTFDNEDVAIIHVSGMDNMPSIQLDDSSQVAEMDNLTLIGFPGNGDVSEQPTNFLTSSINEIYVSALKTTDQSVPVIQVGGNVEHGDSGGPALDAAGHIVGIVSFGLSDSNDIGETTFLQASASAENLMQAGGVDTTPGPLEKAWTQAFDDYASTAAGHWHKAAAELQDLVDTYPSFLGVTPFLTYAQSQANHEAVPATSSAASSSLLLMLVLVLLLGLFIVTLFLILRRQRLALHGGALSSFPSNIAHTSWYEYTTSPRPSTPAPSPFSGERSNVPLSQTPPAPQLPLAPTQPAASLLQQLPLTPVLPVVPETPAASPTVSEPQTLARTALLVAARPGDDEPLMQPQAHPMSGSVETVGTSDRYAWIAPCGHPNEPDVRFCRTCGRPTT